MAEYERPWNRPEWRGREYPFDRMNSVQKSLTPPEKKAIRAIAQESCPYRISPSQSVIVVPGPTAPYMVGEPGYYSREDQSYYRSTLTLEVGEDWLAAKRSGGSSRDPVYKIANVARTCATCRQTIRKGEHYLLEGVGRFCRPCAHTRKGLCGFSRQYKSMADMGQDLRCFNRATGTTAEGVPCCGLHSDAARARGRKLGGK